jgi:hypothetical protein
MPQNPVDFSKKMPEWSRWKHEILEQMFLSYKWDYTNFYLLYRQSNNDALFSCKSYFI